MFYSAIVIFIIVTNENYHNCQETSGIVDNPASILSNLGSGNTSSNYSRDEEEARAFLREHNKRMAEIENENQIASWNYITNLTETNANISSIVELKVF